MNRIGALRKKILKHTRSSLFFLIVPNEKLFPLLCCKEKSLLLLDSPKKRKFQSKFSSSLRFHRPRIKIYPLHSPKIDASRDGSHFFKPFSLSPQVWECITPTSLLPNWHIIFQRNSWSKKIAFWGFKAPTVDPSLHAIHNPKASPPPCTPQEKKDRSRTHSHFPYKKVAAIGGKKERGERKKMLIFSHEYGIGKRGEASLFFRLSRRSREKKSKLEIRRPLFPWRNILFHHRRQTRVWRQKKDFVIMCAICKKQFMPTVLFSLLFLELAQREKHKM